MATDLFDASAEQLERRTSLDRLEARGTLRLAFKAAGIKPSQVSFEQLRVVFERLMPTELDNRGVAEAAAVCRSVIEALSETVSSDPRAGSSDPDAIFGRLGGD